MVSNMIHSDIQELGADTSTEGTTAVEALDKGFADLMDLCDVVANKFIEAREAHASRMDQ
jgi:DNA-directed RNA polymerases I and III subunit RPAC2